MGDSRCHTDRGQASNSILLSGNACFVTCSDPPIPPHLPAQKPEVAQQMAQMSSFLQNQQLQERMKSLKDDPEFADM